MASARWVECIVKQPLIMISCLSAKLQHCYVSEAGWLFAVLPFRIPCWRSCARDFLLGALMNILMHVVLDPHEALPDSICTTWKMTRKIVFSTDTTAVAPVPLWQEGTTCHGFLLDLSFTPHALHQLMRFILKARASQTWTW